MQSTRGRHRSGSVGWEVVEEGEEEGEEEEVVSIC
jgi:hypothetical protein